MTTPPPPGPLASPAAWDLVAPGYEADILPLLERYAGDALRLAALPGTAEILDVAAGPGTLSLVAARTLRHVTAVDFSPDMLARLRRRVAEAALSNITSQLADGQALPFSDSSFDGAFSMFGLFMFPDRAKGFGELCRVLKSGGRALVASWGPFERVPLFVETFSAIGRAMAMPPAPPPTRILDTPEAVHSEMRAAGFRDVTVHEVTHVSEYASIDAAWDSLVRSMAPVALLKKNAGGDKWPAIEDAVRSDLRKHFGEGPQDVPMTALLGLATR